MHFILSGFTQIVMNVTKTVTTATQMATAPTPKDRSTVRVIQDTLVTESRVKVSKGSSLKKWSVAWVENVGASTSGIIFGDAKAKINEFKTLYFNNSSLMSGYHNHNEIGNEI